MTSVDVRRVVAGAVVAIGLIGCTSATEAISADLEGIVESVEAAPAQTRVLMRDALDQKVVWVTPQTQIEVLQRGGVFSAGTVVDIVVGARLRVLTTGAELRSLPPQYQATRVSVLP